MTGVNVVRPGGQDPLNYEINLECADCGHAQAFHCADCGCMSLRHRATATTGSVGCTCTEYVRPPGAASESAVWLSHEHREGTA